MSTLTTPHGLSHGRMPGPASRLASAALPVLVFLLSLLIGAPALAGSDLQIDGRVIEIEGDRVVVDLGADRGADAGRTLFFYRHYEEVRDQMTGRVSSGDTFLGSAEISSVEENRCLVISPFLRLRAGDLVRLAPPPVLSLTEDSSWIPLGLDRDAFRDPFLPRRRLNNRIQVMGEGAKMGDQDFYLGSTVDFTYWPMEPGGLLKRAESIRFGLGAFQGQLPPGTTYQDTVNDGVVRFLYGLAELDVSITPYFNLLPSVKIGLNNRGFGLGGGLKARLGSAQNSHILFGFEGSSMIGSLAFMEMHYFPARRFQTWVYVGFENLPSGVKYGGKMQLGAEYQVTRLVWARAAMGMGGRRSVDSSGAVNREHGLNGELGLSFNFWTGNH